MTKQDKQELIKRRINRDRRDRANIHFLGICGGAADLCQECFQNELEALRAWARKQPKPLPGENDIEYWKRIGGPFVDAWARVAWEAIRGELRREPIPAYNAE